VLAAYTQALLEELLNVHHCFSAIELELIPLQGRRIPNRSQLQKNLRTNSCCQLLIVHSTFKL